jgi:hypothetical protein
MDESAERRGAAASGSRAMRALTVPTLRISGI